MRTIRMFGLEFGIELWTGRWTAIRSWQFAAEREAAGSRLIWFGPLHIAVCPAHRAGLAGGA